MKQRAFSIIFTTRIHYIYAHMYISWLFSLSTSPPTNKILVSLRLPQLLEFQKLHVQLMQCIMWRVSSFSTSMFTNTMHTFMYVSYAIVTEQLMNLTCFHNIHTCKCVPQTWMSEKKMIAVMLIVKLSECTCAK